VASALHHPAAKACSRAGCTLSFPLLLLLLLGLVPVFVLTLLVLQTPLLCLLPLLEPILQILMEVMLI
jgi:hypothetical protein